MRKANGRGDRGYPISATKLSAPLVPDRSEFPSKFESVSVDKQSCMMHGQCHGSAAKCLRNHFFIQGVHSESLV
jgi:hypothetical protein